jgi:hypothetical protein
VRVLKRFKNSLTRARGKTDSYKSFSQKSCDTVPLNKDKNTYLSLLFY